MEGMGPGGGGGPKPGGGGGGGGPIPGGGGGGGGPIPGGGGGGGGGPKPGGGGGGGGPKPGSGGGGGGGGGQGPSPGKGGGGGGGGGGGIPPEIGGGGGGGGGGAGWALPCFLCWHVQTKLSVDLGMEDETEDVTSPDPPLKGTSNLNPSSTGEVWTDTSWLIFPNLSVPICEALWWAAPRAPILSKLPFAKEACWPCNTAILIRRSSMVLSS